MAAPTIAHFPFAGARLLPYRIVGPTDGKIRRRGLLYVRGTLSWAEFNMQLTDQAQILWGLELTSIYLEGCLSDTINSTVGSPSLCLTTTEATASQLPLAVENVLISADGGARNICYQHSYLG